MTIALPTAFTDLACAVTDDTACGWLTRRIGDETVARVLAFAVGKPLLVLGVIIGALVVRLLAQRAIRRAVARIVAGPRESRPSRFDLLEADPMTVARRGQRAQAIGSLLSATVTVVVWVLAALVILPEVGLQIAGLIAGAGIVGVALAFGAQTLVADLVSGIFMIAEDQYGVGDVIDMGEASGVVEAVGLRTTRLRAVDGTVWHVRNGEVKRVGNMSQGWSRALLDIEVAYTEDVDQVMDVMRSLGQTMRQDEVFGPKLLDDPEIWGVEAFGENSVVIRMIMKTKPLEQWSVAREMRRRIKDDFSARGIDIPFGQREVWVRTEGPGSSPASGGAPVARGTRHPEM